MSNRIKEMRAARAMTAADLEAAAGMSRGTVLRMESGHTDPKLGQLRRIAAALGCRTRDLLSEDD